jgi:hypothetical protein
LKGIRVVLENLILQDLDIIEDSITKVNKTIRHLESEISIFSGTKDSFKYQDLLEKLTQCLLDLDAIDVKKKKKIKHL